MLEIISMILLYILVGSSFLMCYDAFLVDEEIENTQQQRAFIKNIYNKVIGMTLKDIRSWLDNTGQFNGVIRLNDEEDTVTIMFEHYVFKFNQYSDYASLTLDTTVIYTGEEFDNFNNRFSIEHVYDILKYHRFDELICENQLRARNGLFLGINDLSRWYSDSGVGNE